MGNESAQAIEVEATPQTILIADLIAGTQIPDPATRREISASDPIPSGAMIVRAAQELPATPPLRYDLEGLSRRNVQSDPLGDWYLALPDKLPPKQVSAILRMALAGNIRQQTQLTQRMLDSWPMFRKCCYELRAAISSVKFNVHPYTVKGKKPSDTAEAKADLVRRALDSFNPDRFADEDGLNGMIFDLTDAIINGVSIVELLWDENATDPEGNPEMNIRGSAWVHPRNLAFTPEGRIGVAYAAESGNMSFSNQVRGDMMDNPSKFLVGKFKSKSGSFLGAGFMRTLTPMWIMVVYGRDFLLNFAQKYGNPFFDISYEAGLSSNQSEVDEFERLARMAANQGYFVHPDTAKLEIGKEHGVTGDNAQTAMMRIADEQCQYLMLGQTLTSSAPANGGTRAQGDVHENVRQERLEEHAKWIARILTEQFAESLLTENFGKSYLRKRERPTVQPDMTRPLSATEQAQFLKDISQSTVAILTDEAYKRAGLTKPSPGDEVLIRGENVLLEEPMTPTDKRAKDFNEQVEQQMTINSLQAPSDDPNNKTDNVPSADSIQAALCEADPEDVAEFANLVHAAESSEHKNGEVQAVRIKFKQILDKRRL